MPFVAQGVHGFQVGPEYVTVHPPVMALLYGADPAPAGESAHVLNIIA
jgi:hypothetical protein